VRCRDATASSFVAKVPDEVFAHFHGVAVKRRISMRNCLVGLPGRISREQPP
jgi:Trm5-related predicted tRNA methylase